MGKTGKWIKSFLTGKKDKEKEKDKDKVKDKKSVSNHLVAAAPTENTTTPIAITPTTPKEKRRWSFRRSPATGSAPRDSVNSMDPTTATPFPVVVQNVPESENEQKQHAMAMVAATAAVIKLTNAANEKQLAIEEAAAIKIQSVFRSFLARKALCALKGLVKLQALVRGHLVRKQATATLRCMQALVTVQARARAQRINMTENSPPLGQRQSVYRRSPQDNHLRHSCDEMDRGMEENIKIVEMDLGESRGNAHSRHSYSNHTQSERGDPRFSAYYPPQRPHLKQDYQHQFSPAQSAVTDMSPRTCSGHFEEYSFATTQSSPQYYSAVSRPDPSRVPFAFPRPEYAESISQDYTFFPNYMANTESFKAKVRSQSAPKQRPDSYERQPSRRRPSIEGRNVPRAVRMQRSSSHVGSAVQGYQYPGSVKLDKSSVSLKDSECGSTSTMLTNTNYCRSLVTFEPHRIRY